MTVGLRFENVTKTIASSTSRRNVMKLLGASLAAAIVDTALADRAYAKPCPGVKCKGHCCPPGASYVCCHSGECCLDTVNIGCCQGSCVVCAPYQVLNRSNCKCECPPDLPCPPPTVLDPN